MRVTQQQQTRDTKMNILDAIKANINPRNTGMDMVSITLGGDGTKVFNKTNGERSPAKKILMESEIGYAPEAVKVEMKNTYLVGSNYQKLQNNRIKKSAKKILTAVQLAGGNDTAELILNGIIEAGEKGEAFETKSLPFGEWVKDWEGILIQHNGEMYLRVYDETPAKKITTYTDPNGEVINPNDEKFSSFRKPAKKESGAVNNLKEALEKILDLTDPDIAQALKEMKAIKPECPKISNILSIRMNGETYTA